MLGNGNNETSGINLKLVAQKWPTEVFPKFAVKVKWEDWKWEVTEETYTKCWGVVTSMKTTNNGKTGHDEVKWFEATLKDWDDTYIIDSTMSNAAKDLANHLLGSIGKKVNISLYLNSNEYPSASVKLDDGAHAPTALDFKGLDKDELYDKIKDQEAPKKEVKEAPKKETKKETKEEVSVDDIPF